MPRSFPEWEKTVVVPQNEETSGRSTKENGWLGSVSESSIDVGDLWRLMILSIR